MNFWQQAVIPRAIVVLSIVLGFFILAGCSALPRSNSRVTGSRYEYPIDFIQPSLARVGYGAAELYPISQDASYSEAMNMAVRHLSWTFSMRVAGERLFERGADGAIAFRGQVIDLAEAVTIDTGACLFDSTAIGGYAWVRVVPDAGGDSAPIATAYMAPARPSWLHELRFNQKQTFAIGMAEHKHGDEAGSWDVATYNALVSIAFNISSKHSQLTKASSDVHVRRTRVNTDVVVKDFRVVERWRDSQNVYVLVSAEK